MHNTYTTPVKMIHSIKYRCVSYRPYDNIIPYLEFFFGNFLAGVPDELVPSSIKSHLMSGVIHRSLIYVDVDASNDGVSNVSVSRRGSYLVLKERNYPVMQKSNPGMEKNNPTIKKNAGVSKRRPRRMQGGLFTHFGACQA